MTFLKGKINDGEFFKLKRLQENMSKMTFLGGILIFAFDQNLQANGNKRPIMQFQKCFF